MRFGSTTQVIIALAILIPLALLAMTGGGLRMRWDYVGAITRAALQLTIVALLIAGIFAHPQWAVLYLGVMFVAATATSVRRIGCGWRGSRAVLVPILAGALLAVVPVVGVGALPVAAQSLVPFSALIIGGAMTAVSLTGSYAAATVRRDWNLVEGYLALGGTARQSVLPIARESAQHALVPGFDQTRSAGLVVLPGAFVGMLLGGATPTQAAQVQLLVLAALAVAAAGAAATSAWTLAPWLASTPPPHESEQ